MDVSYIVGSNAVDEKFMTVPSRRWRGRKKIAIFESGRKITAN